MAWDISQFVTAWTSGWVGLCVLSTAIVIFAYGLVYAVARAFGNMQYVVKAKSEMLQAVFSFLLALFAVLVFSNLFNSVVTLIGGKSYVVCGPYGKISLENAGPLEDVRCRLMSTVLRLSVLYQNMLISARGPFAKFYLSWGLLGFPIYYSGSYVWQTTASSLYFQVENYRFLNDVMVHLMIGLNAYLAAIDYIGNTMLTMFLPIGLVLRSNPFTRGVGALFIAIALGLYIVFPLAFFLTDVTFVRQTSPAPSLLTGNPAEWCWKSFKGAVALTTLPPQAGQTQTYGLSNLSATFSSIIRLYYLLLLQPFIAFSISVISMKYLANIFGGESQELARAAMRLI